MNIKAIKVRQGVSFIFSIRCEDADGVESEVCQVATAREADRILEQLEQITLHRNAGEIARLAIAALMSIEKIAYRIALTGDTQADAHYATKSHMRLWAEEICGIAAGSIEIAIPKNRGDASSSMAKSAPLREAEVRGQE